MREFFIDKTHLGCFGHSKQIHPTAIVIHHTCTRSPESTRRELQKHNYSTHFEVDRDGSIYQYVKADRMAFHCGSANCHAIGIDVTHPKDAEWPEVQVEAVKWLVSRLCEELNISHEVHTELSGVYPHKALGNTACPQDFPMEMI